MDWVTIDFEASCLPQHGRSFPIEVGICGPFGTCSWLVKPQPEWQDWDWTEEAFRLHAISRELLDREGLAPAIIVAEVRRTIGGSRVVSDSLIDRAWWQTLLDAAGETLDAAPINIEHVSDVFDEIGATADQIQFAQWRADALCAQRHRAGSDARWLFTLLSSLSERIEAQNYAAAHKLFPSWITQEAYVRNLAKPQTAKEKEKQLRYTNGH